MGKTIATPAGEFWDAMLGVIIIAAGLALMFLINWLVSQFLAWRRRARAAKQLDSVNARSFAAKPHPPSKRDADQIIQDWISNRVAEGKSDVAYEVQR